MYARILTVGMFSGHFHPVPNIIKQVFTWNGGGEVVETEDGFAALKKLNEVLFDGVLFAWDMEPMTAPRFLCEVPPRVLSLPLIAAVARPEDEAKATALGASACICKPVSAHSLVQKMPALLTPDTSRQAA